MPAAQKTLQPRKPNAQRDRRFRITLIGRNGRFPARRIFDRAWNNGLIIRAFPTGVLGYAPPLCCSESDIEAIVERTAMILDETLADADVRTALQ